MHLTLLDRLPFTLRVNTFNYFRYFQLKSGFPRADHIWNNIKINEEKSLKNQLKIPSWEFNYGQLPMALMQNNKAVTISHDV